QPARLRAGEDQQPEKGGEQQADASVDERDVADARARGGRTRHGCCAATGVAPPAAVPVAPGGGAGAACVVAGGVVGGAAGCAGVVDAVDGGAVEAAVAGAVAPAPVPASCGCVAVPTASATGASPPIR